MKRTLNTREKTLLLILVILVLALGYPRPDDPQRPKTRKPLAALVSRPE